MYAQKKPIENTHIVRERDRKRFRELFSVVVLGLFIAGFLVAGQVYVNGLADGDLRASVQGLFSCINGMGLLLGNLLAGAVRHATGNDLPATFAVAAGLALLMLAAFAARFRS